MGPPSLLGLKQLLFLCLALALFDIFAKFVIFVKFITFVPPPPLPLASLKNCYSCCYRLLYSLFLLYLWVPLPFSALKNCYSCWYRLLDVSFLLNLLFSLFLLYLLGPFPFSALENCYSYCCRLLHLLFLYILSKCFVIFAILAIACISGHISLTVSYHISQKPNYKKLGRASCDATEY